MKTAVLTQSSVYAGTLILVNAQHPYHEDAEPHMHISVNQTEHTVLLECHTVRMLSRLMDDIHGWSEISAVSGWRSLEEQCEIYTQSLQDNGEEFTQKFVARPGCSEHQTGLAIDLGIKKDDIDFICPDFPYTGICQTFREKAAQFGFIERYPHGKEQITGIAQEPWHFRYVGTPHAEIMSNLNFSLEEYHEFLKRYPYGRQHYLYSSRGARFSISYLEAQKARGTRFKIDGRTLFWVSGNNVDGFIITERRD